MFQAHGIQSHGGYNQNQGPHHSHHGEQIRIMVNITILKLIKIHTMVTITTSIIHYHHYHPLSSLSLSSTQVLMVAVMVLTMVEVFSIITVQVTYQVLDIWPTWYSPAVSFSVGYNFSLYRQLVSHYSRTWVWWIYCSFFC